MAISLIFYSDAALTVPITPPLNAPQADDGSTGPLDFVLYLGSATAGKKFQAASNPGIDDIVLSVVDSAPGTGHPASEVKLAATLGGLDVATGGAPLDLGPQILSGAANAVPVFVRINDTTGVVATSTELSLQTNNVTESNV